MHFARSTFTDMAISPSGRYVFAADYGGEANGYGDPAVTNYVHRLDLYTNTWETKTAYTAGGIQAVSDNQVILKSIEQWVGFTNNSWGSGDALVALNAPTGGYWGPSYYAFVFYGDFRYDANTGRLLHGNSGLSSQEIQAFRIVANDFVREEGSGMYGTAQGYGDTVALATDSSAFYYGRLQVDPLNVSHTLRVFPELIYAATGNFAFGDGRYYDAHTGDLVGSLGFETTVYALSPNGDEFWAYDPRQNVLNHFAHTGAACPSPYAPTGVTATVIPGTADIMMSWTTVPGATGYKIYMASQPGGTKTNYALLLGGHVHSNITGASYTHAGALSGSYYLVVTAVNSTGESGESSEVSITVPDYFSFAAQNNVPMNTVITSNSVSVTGISAPTTISIAGGEYSINDGAFANAPGMVANGDSVVVRVTSPSSYGATATAALSIGGMSAAFSVTTPALWTAAGYVPLPDNATWSYVRDGASYTTTILPGTAIFNDATVKQAQDSDDGSISYYTNDAYGILEYGAFSPSVFVSGYGYMTLSLLPRPPLKRMDAQFFLGQSFPSSGQIFFVFRGGNDSIGIPYSYTATSTPVGFETVTVPAGTFNALRVDRSLRIYGSVGSSSMDVTEQGSEWSVDGLGLIKCVITTNDGTETTTSNEVLTAASLLDALPDPFSFAALTSVAVGASVTSNAITVQGINVGVDISVIGGEYSIDGGPWTSSAGMVFNEQSVSLRQTAPAGYGITTGAMLTIGGVSAPFSVTTGPSVPSAPAGVTAAAGNASATVSFLAPASNGGAAITSYTVTSSPGGIAATGTTSPITVTGLTNGTAYTFTVAANNSAGTGPASSVSNIVQPLLPDTTPPSVPNGLAASTVSSSQIDLSWTAATDSVGVAAYKVYRGGVLIRTLGNVTAYSNTGLIASTNYIYTVVACDAAGNCSGSSAAASAMTPAAAAGSMVFNPQVLAKWNLLGNTGTVALDVTVLFGTQDAPLVGVTPYVLSVWKWVVYPESGAGKWAFFTPSLTKDESDAAALTLGYDVLSTINPGEGFWVNRTLPPSTAVTLNGPASEPFFHDAVSFGALRKHAWHLIGTYSPVEPSIFNVSDVSATPPPVGVVPTGNFQTLWAWSASLQKWYFYATLIEANGYTSATGTVYTGLDAVRQAAVDGGYLDFHTATPPMILGTGVGFWVRR